MLVSCLMTGASFAAPFRHSRFHFRSRSDGGLGRTAVEEEEEEEERERMYQVAVLGNQHW